MATSASRTGPGAAPQGGRKLSAVERHSVCDGGPAGR